MKSSGSDLLYTKNLSKFFDGLKALNGVNINVKESNITLIIGPNGSGKTTFINTVSGFYKADEGHVYFEGVEITNKPPHEIYQNGIVRTFQIPQPLKKLTVLENLLIANYNPGEGVFNSLTPSWKKVEDEMVNKAFDVLEFLRIDHLWDNYAYQLSGGQLKLLEVGRAMMTNAKLIIMDEPVAGVNPVLAESILDRITELKKMGYTFLIVEHRLDLVLPYVDYIYVMASGQVIAQGVEEEIMNNKEVIEVYLGDTYRESECRV
jgi:branched-chain amino acid transport system ATP-binding protein